MERSSILCRLLTLSAAVSLIISCGTPRGSQAVSNGSVQSPDVKDGASPSLPVMTEPVEKDAARIQFAANLFRTAAADQKDRSDNLVVSPFSAGEALSMLMEGASGATRTEIENALCGGSFSGILPVSDDDVTIESANSIWMRQGFQIRRAYESLLTQAYAAQILTRDFASQSTVGEINRWCSDHTNGKIPTIIDRISPDMAMFILNALYFNAPWAHKFDPEDTAEMVFHSASADQRAKFMKAQKKYRYAELAGNQIISLPYQGDRYTMLVALPSAGSSAESILEYLSAQALEQIEGSMSFRTVSLSLPKFKVERTMDLNDVLRSLGISRAFTSSAEFGAMTQSRVCVDQVKQKTFIDVSEQGTEAAAVTSIGVRLTSVRPQQDIPVVMTVDRPFIFCIKDTGSGDILFAGIIRNLK